MNTLPARTHMQRAVLTRDSSFDGTFFVAVRSTNIFCLPSCPARKPLPRNMDFFATAREAMLAGYRPCRRCHPMELSRPPRWAAALLARVESAPSRRIPDLSLRGLGVDPARARRYFQRSYGMTFQGYCRARRMGEALRKIRDGQTSDEVALGSGYESHSGFREAFRKTTGSTLGRAVEDCIVTTLIESPLGSVVAGATRDGICLLEFADRRLLEHQFKVLRSRFGVPIVPGANRHLVGLRDELRAYFEGRLRLFSVPLVTPGTPFEERVWRALRELPYGTTVSYEELARTVGAPRAARAVGRANGMNRISIVIPCHRVIAKDGKLGGYGGGLWRKQRLLELERGEPSLFAASSGASVARSRTA